MTYVIAQPCIGTKDASCVEVCPVDCIHSDDDAEQYYINPAECIDCGVCAEVCPVEAIYFEDESHDYISPHIQVSFPVTDRTNFRLSYALGDADWREEITLHGETLGAIDGLYARGDTLIAVQNVTNPGRVVELRLDANSGRWYADSP